MTRLYDRRVWRRALEIALPLMLAESMDSILWITDTYFVSWLGDEALAAVGVGGYLGWLVFVFGSLFYMGALVVVAQLVGAGRGREAVDATGEAMTANALLALPVAAAAWLAAPSLVSAITGGRQPPIVEEMAVDYFRARLIGVPFTYAALALDAAYRGFGRTRPVLYATAAFTAFNAALDPVLILGLLGAPRLGIAGAGYASSLASIVYLAVLWRLTPRAMPAAPRPRPPTARTILMARLGAPALAERIAFVGGNLAYLGVVARCGEAALAAHTIGVRIESLAFLPIFAIGESAATLSGQHTGRGELDQAKHAGWEVAKLNTLAGVATGLLIAALAPIVPRAFTRDPAVLDLAETYLLIAAATEPLFAIAISLSMAIRGAGNTAAPTAINLASLYLLRVVPATQLPRLLPPGLCALGAWTAMAIDMAGRASISTIVYKRLFHRLARRVV